MKNKLPNFLIVGAAKSGTSSLHNYLNQHPEVFMPSYNKEGMKVKEPRFLIKDLVQHRLHNGVWSWEEYKSLFNEVKNEISIGESTVLYLYYYEHAIDNIKKYLGENVKIIIMLRNPTDRAYSAFQHVSRGFKEQNSFEEALKIEEGRMDKEPSLTPMVMYKEMGLYHDMVRAYKENFKNVHIIFYEVQAYRLFDCVVTCLMASNCILLESLSRLCLALHLHALPTWTNQGHHILYVLRIQVLKLFVQSFLLHN